MKGIVFTELVEFVEDQFGYTIADDMLEASMLDHKGAYTQGGNYPYEELVAILKRLSQRVDLSVETLIEVYARHLFTKIVMLYPKITDGFNSVLKFISVVDTFIHPEVKKLYPEAELPTFEMVSLVENCLVIDYHSSRPLYPMAVGLMLGASDYFKQTIEVHYDINDTSSGASARFTIILIQYGEITP